MFLGILQTTIIILKYFGIDSIILIFFGGISFPMLGLLFIMSYVFKYCYLYRIPLYYIATICFITTVDTFIGIPLETLDMFRVYFTNIGIFLVLYVYYAYKNRNNPKVDYLKQLCERYNCNCK